MTYTVVPDKDVGASFTEAMWDTYIKDNLNDALARPIGHTVLGSATQTVTFSSIPGGMGALAAVWSARGDQAATTTAMGLRFNGDTGTTYDYNGCTGSNGFVGDEGYTQTSIRLGLIPAATAIANQWASGIVFVPAYANGSVHKTSYAVDALKTANASFGMRVSAYAGFWESTAAITSLSFFGGAGNFIVGSRFTLFALGLV
jgi:hypothetical protein